MTVGSVVHGVGLASLSVFGLLSNILHFIKFWKSVRFIRMYKFAILLSISSDFPRCVWLDTFTMHGIQCHRRDICVSPHPPLSLLWSPSSLQQFSRRTDSPQRVWVLRWTGKAVLHVATLLKVNMILSGWTGPEHHRSTLGEGCDVVVSKTALKVSHYVSAVTHIFPTRLFSGSSPGSPSSWCWSPSSWSPSSTSWSTRSCVTRAMVGTFTRTFLEYVLMMRWPLSPTPNS